jgi:hypothetical protein
LKVAVCIASINPELGRRCLELAVYNGTPDLECIVLRNGPEAQTWVPESIRPITVLSEPELIGYPQAMDKMWKSRIADIYVFIHDDVHLYNAGWDAVVEKVFREHGGMAIGGFAGGTGLGFAGMYGPDTGFDVGHLGRSGFRSSIRSWRQHGESLQRPTRFAMLDGLSFCIRRDFLEKIGGWSWWKLPHHGYDLAMSCMAARHAAEIWGIPLDCEHLGGQTACAATFQAWARERFGSEAALFIEAHRQVYEEFRDVLPIRV